ncbi:hypothetical protein BC941DRAFT_264801 [Chlamydoabsidia padenii]|nr:hypothetical protein BC941DRAFT_264801 [Chlamydoabsidia padenii]
MTTLKNQSTPVLVGNHRSSAPILTNSHHHYKDSASINKYSSLSMGSVDALSSGISVCTSMTSSQSSLRLSQSFDHLDLMGTQGEKNNKSIGIDITSNLLRKSSELFRNSNKNGMNSINNVSSISSTGSLFSDDSQYLYDSSIPSTPATPTVSTSRKLPRVTTLSNLAMRYLSSSTSTITPSYRLSQNMTSNQQQHQQNAMLPPPSPAISYTTNTHNTSGHAHASSLPPPTSNRSDTRLLNSKSTPTFDQIKLSTSQSLRNMGVASLRNISRKPRRLSNQNRKSDSVMPPPIPFASHTTTHLSPPTSASSLPTSTTDTISQQADPPLRLRISSSLRLRRSADNSDQREKAAQEQKLREEEEEEEKRSRPWYLKKMKRESQIAFNTEGHMVGASLQVLVEIMTCHEDSPGK